MDLHSALRVLADLELFLQRGNLLVCQRKLHARMLISTPSKQPVTNRASRPSASSHVSTRAKRHRTYLGAQPHHVLIHIVVGDARAADRPDGRLETTRGCGRGGSLWRSYSRRSRTAQRNQ